MSIHLGLKRWPALLLLAASLAGALFLGIRTKPDPWPGLSKESCWFNTGQFRDVRCGYLRVPESRSNPESRTIAIAVVVILPESLHADSSLPPLVFLTGGPGAGSGLDREGMEWWADTRWEVSWMQDRPLILVDYRGAGLSSPVPACPEIPNVDVAYFLGQINDATAAEAWRDAADQCRSRLIQHGIDLAAYDSAADATDLVDLRRALGISQWDIWSVSYGTQVAFALLRMDEVGIRSVVFDSAAPPEALLFTGIAQSFDAAIRRMRDDCLANPTCAERFGDIRESIARVAERFEEQPLPARFYRDDGSIEELAVTKSMFLRTVFINLYDEDDAVWLPLMIDDALRQDYRLLSEFVTSFAGGLGSDDPSTALLLSHFCRDEFPFEPPEGLRRPPGPPPFDGFNPPLRELAICPDWAGVADPGVNLPVRSDVPALFLSGVYDVATPTAWARAAQQNLPNAYLLEFPGAAHAVILGDACGVKAVGAFLANPFTVPQVPCLSELPALEFALALPPSE